LAKALSIDYENSKSLGPKGGSITFIQKTTLLLELGFMNKRYHPMFQAFGEIRNKFAHVRSIENFLDFEQLSPSSLKFLKKQHQQNDNESEEEYLATIITFLYSNIRGVLEDMAMRWEGRNYNNVKMKEAYNELGNLLYTVQLAIEQNPETPASKLYPFKRAIDKMEKIRNSYGTNTPWTENFLNLPLFTDM
jgi:hypothetical protein